MTDVQAPHDWQFLLNIFNYLGRLDNPLAEAFASQEDRKKVLTRALRSRKVPVRGCRDTSLGPETSERIEAKIDAETEINISLNEITLRRVYDIPTKDKSPGRKDRLEIALFKRAQVDRARLEQWLRMNFLPASQHQKKGRKPMFDWGQVDDEVHRLMEENGEFMPCDPQWNCQAQLEKEIADFIFRKFRAMPVESVIREHVVPSLEKWRNAKAGN